MSYKKKTMIFVLLVIVIIAAWDVYVILFGGTESSISHLLIVWSYKYPAFTFLTGFVMGHLFWRVKETKELSSVTGAGSDIPKD